MFFRLFNLIIKCLETLSTCIIYTLPIRTPHTNKNIVKIYTIFNNLCQALPLNFLAELSAGGRAFFADLARLSGYNPADSFAQSRVVFLGVHHVVFVYILNV